MRDVSIAVLDASDDRGSFESGSPALDTYFRHQVTQDIRRHIASCFVARVDAPAAGVAGFYTLAAASVYLGDLPAALAKKLPRYPTVPAVRMGRLAVSVQWQGQRLGAALLADALLRAARSEVAAYALIVDAKDEQAAAFYRQHGFITLADRPLSLFLPLDTVRDATAKTSIHR